MHSISEVKKFPICDTDIWVNLCLGDIVSDLFLLHDKIVIADVVENEILKFKNSERKIYDYYIEYKEKGCILVIEHNKYFSSVERQLLTRQLFGLDFKYGLDNFCNIC